MNPLSKVPMGVLYDRTVHRTESLRKAGFVVKEMWECEWRRLLKTDRDVASRVEAFDIDDPLNPRDALAGGRYVKA
jgi:G:T-mismatch repair DNA endonuclease (very short patch repair protein)